MLEVARDRRPDVIIVDYKMPIMNGEQAIKALRADGLIAHIPAIMLTASVAYEETFRLREISNAFLRKPTNRMELIGALTQFLDHELLSEEQAEEVVLSSSPVHPPPNFVSSKSYAELKATMQTVSMILDTGDMQGVIELSGTLEVIGTEENSDWIRDLGHRISEDGEHFRIRQLKQHLEELTQFIHDLDESNSESGTD